MSLYNAMFGTNPIAPLILKMLSLDMTSVGRFRDAYLDERDGVTVLAVYTRNGGGNREHWAYSHPDKSDVEVEVEGKECSCTGCIQTYRIPKHPNYITDADDDFDCTYATTWFSIPDEYMELIDGVVGQWAGAKPEQSPGARFQSLITAIQDTDETHPDYKRALEVGEMVFGKLDAAIENGGPAIIEV